MAFPTRRAILPSHRSLARAGERGLARDRSQSLGWARRTFADRLQAKHRRGLARVGRRLYYLGLPGRPRGAPDRVSPTFNFLLKLTVSAKHWIGRFALESGERAPWPWASLRAALFIPGSTAGTIAAPGGNWKGASAPSVSVSTAASARTARAGRATASGAALEDHRRPAGSAIFGSAVPGRAIQWATPSQPRRERRSEPPLDPAVAAGGHFDRGYSPRKASPASRSPLPAPPSLLGIRRSAPVRHQDRERVSREPEQPSSTSSFAGAGASDGTGGRLAGGTLPGGTWPRALGSAQAFAHGDRPTEGHGRPPGPSAAGTRDVIVAPRRAAGYEASILGRRGLRARLQPGYRRTAGAPAPISDGPTRPAAEKFAETLWSRRAESALHGPLGRQGSSSTSQSLAPAGRGPKVGPTVYVRAPHALTTVSALASPPRHPIHREVPGVYGALHTPLMGHARVGSVSDAAPGGREKERVVPVPKAASAAENPNRDAAIAGKSTDGRALADQVYGLIVERIKTELRMRGR